MTGELPGLRRDAARAMWCDYAGATGRSADDELAVERFGDSPALADELLALVLAGTKRATAALVADFVADGEPLPRIGGHWVVCDGAGEPRCVLRSVELRIGPLASVDDAFAWDEGEGDRTRDWWVAGHRAFFRRWFAATGKPADDDPELVFERFEVVYPR